MYDTPQADLPRFVMPPTVAEAYALAQAAMDAANNNSAVVSTTTINTSGPDFNITDSNVADIINVDPVAIGAASNIIIDQLSVSKIIIIKDISGGANSNPINVKVGAGVTASPNIDPLYIISNANGSVTLFYDASTKTLTVI